MRYIHHNPIQSRSQLEWPSSQKWPSIGRTFRIRASPHTKWEGDRANANLFAGRAAGVHVTWTERCAGIHQWWMPIGWQRNSTYLANVETVHRLQWLVGVIGRQAAIFFRFSLPFPRKGLGLVIRVLLIWRLVLGASRSVFLHSLPSFGLNINQ